MKVLVAIGMKGTIEWHNYVGVTGINLNQPDPCLPLHITVIDGDAEAPYEGTYDDILDQARARLPKAYDTFVEQLDRALTAINEQPIPNVELDKHQLANHAQESRNRRRDWLIAEIENGNIGAAEFLKREFGETIRLTVEVIGVSA